MHNDTVSDWVTLPEDGSEFRGDEEEVILPMPNFGNGFPLNGI